MKKTLNCRTPSLIRNGLLLACTLFYSALSLLPVTAQATPHKCVGAGGKVEYTDGPCKPGSTEQAIKAKPVTVMKSEAITGQAPKAKDNRPGWLKEANESLDPVAKCKAKGGTIDKELRACALP
jgi:Domain of unknown function (DUF4124)